MPFPFFKNKKTLGVVEGEGEGFVFATTGAEYTNLARRAARTLRRIMPRANVDLFTDQDITDETFDQIHQVNHTAHRPKMEALQRSRFHKTIYLDADIVVLHDLSDVFKLMDLNDFLGVLGPVKSKYQMEAFLEGIPHGFPVINSGVIGMVKTEKMMNLVSKWNHAFDTSGLKKDQPILRGLLYQNGIVPLVLPQEYNMIKLATLEKWQPVNGAIRCLHVRDLHSNAQKDPTLPIELDEFLPPRLVKKVLDAQSGPKKP